MVIYPAEKLLENKITANIKTYAYVPISIQQYNKEIGQDDVVAFQNNLDPKVNKPMKQLIASIEGDEHPLLMYGSAILVSTIMNLNDDIFLPKNTWAARNTPIGTPYNDQHNAEDILGHIYAVRALDEDGESIDWATEASDLPDKYHLEADFVLYQFIFPDKAKEVAEGAEDGTKFVSMECYFDDFDYGLIDEKGNAKIVARNKETAFLTQHLRCYGGNGKFDNYRVGRVLKNIVFSGMGNVDNPANPESEYTSIENFEAANAEILQDLKVGMYNTNEQPNNSSCIHIFKGKAMNVENFEQAKELIAKLTKELEDLKATNTQAEITSLKSEIEDRESKIETLEASITELKSQVETLEQDKTKADEAKTEAETKLAEVNTELENIKAEKQAAERKAQLETAGIEVTDEEIEDLKSMTDDAFAKVLEFASRKKDKASEEVEEETEASLEDELEDVEVEDDSTVAEVVSDTEEETDDVKTTATKLAAAIMNTTKKRTVNITKKDK